MKRLERDHAKARKRADQLQKEKDHSRSEMQKAVSMKHKLETLCRELQKENKRIKVYIYLYNALAKFQLKGGTGIWRGTQKREYRF